MRECGCGGLQREGVASRHSCCARAGTASCRGVAAGDPVLMTTWLLLCKERMTCSYDAYKLYINSYCSGDSCLCAF